MDGLQVGEESNVEVSSISKRWLKFRAKKESLSVDRKTWRGSRQ